MPDTEPREVELKLAASGEAMDTLLASQLLRAHARSPVRTRQLVTTYYDTDDHRLGRRRLALRVRQSGRRFIQTLKSANKGQGAETSRGEWEVELPDSTPQLTAFNDPTVLDLTGLVLPDELQATYETRFKRRALLVDWPDPNGEDARIEVAFDRGAVRAGGAEAPISEIELELKLGKPRALFELAQSMRELVPLRLQTVDKAARGYALVTGQPPGWRKAGAVELGETMTVEDALQAILGACVRHWVDNEAATSDARDPEGLHQLRVALRRLRSALALFKPALAPAARAHWAGELRWLLGPMGPARDLDVFATETVPPLHQARPNDQALAMLLELVDGARWKAHQTVRDTLASGRYGDIAFGLACWVACRGWRQGADIDVLLAQRQPAREFAAAILAKRHRQVRRRGRHFASLAPAERHELRILFKKLRYGTEFFASLFPGRELDRYRAAAARMQDLLGTLNDVAVAQHVVDDLLAGTEPGVRQRAAALGGGQVLGWYAHHARDLEPGTVEAWEEFRAAEPFWPQPVKAA
ncbi:MAG: CHAD domain-containing protein [Geminicoccaceae bacterium]